MKLTYAVQLVLLLLIGSVSSFWFCADKKWDKFKVKWSYNPISSSAFYNLPRSTDADLRGFVEKDYHCNDAHEPVGPFAGTRYWKDADPALMLIFDVNGIIAGIQTAVPKSQFAPMAGPTVNHPWIEDGDNWVLTAYFVDPSTICNGGRTKEDLENQGTGTGLYLQNGTNPKTDILFIDQDERKTLLNTKWTFGKCFYTMGNHYWYNVRENMPCNEFFPMFLMYNKKKLNAFGFAINGQLSSPRYEHPTHDVLNKFLNPVPTCLETEPAYEHLSTMHVFFTDVLGNRC
uniref:Uncharacterized protein n=1 Tax=Plectus sambesii TaxID=2011161 RepID=A0A914VIG1_9BILA